MAAKHFFNIESVKAQKTFPGGSRTSLTSEDVSSFTEISFSLLKLKPGSAQEATWHPNSHKLGYCTQGKAVVTILSPNAKDTFTIGAGEIFFVPKGHFHQITCTDAECHIAFALSNTKPDEMFLSKALLTLPETVFSSTFHTPESFFTGLKKNKVDAFISSSALKKETLSSSSRYKLSVAASSPLLTTPGGYLKAATKPYLPLLEGLGILTFGLNPKGIVEPHWHTNAGELIYIVKGHARISILAPEGSVDIAEVHAGGGGFAPAGHFHSIENIGNENVEVVAFFNDQNPDYIGVGECAAVLSKEILGATFGLPADYFAHFEPPTGPVVIGAPAPELAKV